jgi:thermitase
MKFNLSYHKSYIAELPEWADFPNQLIHAIKHQRYAYFMRRQVRLQCVIKPVFWLVLICVPLWGLGLQTLNVSAYQSEDLTPSPTLELTATPSPEETQPTLADTPDATLTAEPAETVTSLPVIAPLAVENSVVPTSTDSPPLPVLPGEYAPDEVVIEFKKDAPYESILQCLSSSNAMALSSIEELNVWVVRVPFGKVAESTAAISACPEVRYAEPNYVASIADTIPSDPNWNLQYGLVNIRAPQGWDYSTGSAAVTIAILDSGVDLGHADLASKIVPGYDFVNGDAIPQDDNGHGTHVAGIAAATGNNNIGVTGVSWGARIMPVKVLNAAGGGLFANVAAGIIWAADNGAQVINLSLGGSSPSTVLQDAVNYAYGKGVVLVAAAGNTGSNFVLYPAHYPNVIAVGAVDSANNYAGFSNFGPELDLVAPGTSIYSTVIGGYGYKSGTSMSAPYVSGLAAILCGINSSPASVTFEMESTALDLGAAGFDDSYGFGLIQLDSALKLALPRGAVAPRVVPVRQFPAIVSLTYTSTPTAFASPTATVTSTLLPPTIQPTVSATPEALASPTHQKQEMRAQSSSSWQLPWAGLTFLLAGLLLLWVARRRR